MSITPLPKISPLPNIPTDHLILVDIYHGDGDIQMHALQSAGVSGVLIKATQGNTYVDPLFSTNWERAGAVGLERGAYCYFLPGDDPVDQAEHLLKTAPLKSGDLPYILDIEQYGEGMAANAYKAAQYLKSKTGRWPWIYTGDAFYQSYLSSTFPEHLYTLWIARYGHEPETQCDLWQYTDSGRVTGVSSALDLDVYFGDLNSLRSHALQ